MKLLPPPYFKEAHQEAATLWEDLESRPVIAAPWYQLFEQVSKSPRHVISELLQNADDAEATEVSIRIENNVFIFEHNGRDFSPDELASLCRLAYSNKRALRTIGFRGIGFKSTFSLGDEVRLQTPTLSIAYLRKRFTLPLWIDCKSLPKNTQISVRIKDDRRTQELLSSMEDWADNPFSLLFFNHIRHLKIEDKEFSWRFEGQGPIKGSEKYVLMDDTEEYLVFRSQEEEFPDEALEEISEQRSPTSEVSIDQPPCRVEIVLGAPGNFYAILPTGVTTSLPFAVNAPFLQDPSRVDITRPAMSATNSWLCKRIGELAASSMIDWLNKTDLPIEERARAYELLPPKPKNEQTIAEASALEIWNAFAERCENTPLLLTSEGKLEYPAECIAIPRDFWDIWSNEQLITLFNADFPAKKMLYRGVSLTKRGLLGALGTFDVVSQQNAVGLLEKRYPPKPESWPCLLALWTFINEYRRHYWFNANAKILPVQGNSVLCSRNEVVRLGDVESLHQKDDWDFLCKYVVLLDEAWIHYLKHQEEIAFEQKRGNLAEQVDACNGLLQKWELHVPTNLDDLINQVALNMLTYTASPEDWIRLAHIAAHLGVTVRENFRYITRDLNTRPVSKNILFDSDGVLEPLLPPKLRPELLLDERYAQNFQSCTKDSWGRWAFSAKSGLASTIPILRRDAYHRTKEKLQNSLKRRGYDNEPNYYYASPRYYEVQDFTFEYPYLEFWRNEAKENPGIYWQIISFFTKNPAAWAEAKTAKVIELGTGTYQHEIISRGIVPQWILHFREFACLRDTRGNFRLPGDLMRRTPQTEALLDVESFIHAEDDFEAARPLYDLLGVHSAPTGPKQILERIRALAKVPNPPVKELSKWYDRLDTLYDHCSTIDQQLIVAALREEPLIFLSEGEWRTSASVYQQANEQDVPDAPLIPSIWSHLSLWIKIGVTDRPTADLTIAWLQGLPSKVKIPQADTPRVRAILGKHPLRVWEACRHWLNLLGEWTPTEDLDYVSRQSLTKWKNLFNWVKQQTADMQMLSDEQIQSPQFAHLPTLTSRLEKRRDGWYSPFAQQLTFPWLVTQAKILIHILLPDEKLMGSVRACAMRLMETKVELVEELKTTPYLDGRPAGMSDKEEIAWIGQVLYVEELSTPKLLKKIGELLSSSSDWKEMGAIVNYCYEKTDAQIDEYIRENYSIDENVLQGAMTGLQDVEDDDDNGGGGDKLKDILDDGSDPPINEPGDSDLDPRKPDHGGSRRSRKGLSLVDRFAQSLGFAKRTPLFYSRGDHFSLGKEGGLFPWVIQDPQGYPLRYLWFKDHCLQQKPLELPVEIWEMLEANPKEHSLILENLDGQPEEYHGEELVSLKAEESLSIFPGTYRLVIKERFEPSEHDLSDI